jgi:hypothetical protein
LFNSSATHIVPFTNGAVLSQNREEKALVIKDVNNAQ